MSRFIAFPNKPTAHSRFKNLSAALMQTTARRQKSATKPRSKASQTVPSKTSANNSAKAVSHPKHAPAIKAPSAEELRLKEAQDARINADIAAAMERKEAQDIKRMWTRAIIKAGRVSIAHGASLSDFNRSVRNTSAGLTGQASVDAFWRSIHKKMEARGY